MCIAGYCFNFIFECMGYYIVKCSHPIKTAGFLKWRSCKQCLSSIFVWRIICCCMLIVSYRARTHIHTISHAHTRTHTRRHTLTHTYIHAHKHARTYSWEQARRPSHITTSLVEWHYNASKKTNYGDKYACFTVCNVSNRSIPKQRFVLSAKK